MGISIRSIYADSLALTKQMLDAARRADWDGLMEFERQRSALVESLQNNEEKTLEGDDQTAVENYIHDILASDAEIKTLTESWMRELQELLGSIGTEKKLLKTYASP